ncbi:ribonuclease catalytic domain-containing protein [Bradymonas sediminis]|uniref:RNB domain-containing protein n=1 Tax=Bradymonas sediminis TaxID=1548548 RepID=A0A2Z4FHC1_9DELT|nr:ribonuclease catalytic domain-containing protein [Bradymonas sediminis]AWV88391.1 hypothetical protein DN745_03135 [Bradymonas sediminis]TDP77518.1 exoribonuclease-2 [Bradymonas sediminis]
MNIGELIEFSSGDDFRLGAVVGEIGKKKLEIVSSEGEKMRALRTEVTFESGVKIADVSESTAESGARRFARQVEEAAAEVEVEMLWEFVKDADEPMTLAELSELFFGEVNPPNLLAIFRVLRDDIIYFKQKKAKRDDLPRFEPRPIAQVEQMQRQREAELEKERERDIFIDGVCEILAVEDPPERAALSTEKMTDTSFRRLAHVVQDYAIHDEDSNQLAQANELLDQIEERAGRRLRGSKNLRAFELMVEAGIWDTHENLHLLRRNISTSMSADILEEVRKVCAQAWTPEEWRRDATEILTFSIDDISTRDIDDALSVEFLEDGGFRVGVHIADPSARVPVGCELDADARARGTSVYLPTGNYPMFSPELSHGLMSLVAGELRPSVSTFFDFSADLELVGSEVVPTSVVVDHRLTYAAVDALLSEDDAETPEELAGEAELARALALLQRAAEVMLAERNAMGAVSIDLPELDMKVDYSGDEPVVYCEVLDSNSEARKIVSEWMVANNKLLGEFCREHQLPAIYRTQPKPDEELYTDEILALPEGVVREFALVRKMKPGEVSTEPAPHFGLGLSAYVQGSSPIRRFNDLVCQRQVKAFLAGEPLPYDETDIVEVLGTVENTAKDAKITERETTRYWMLHHLAGRKGEPMQATVVEHKDHNDALAAVFLHDVALKATCKFTKRPEVGEVCEVTVSSADPRKDTLYLRSI